MAFLKIEDHSQLKDAVSNVGEARDAIQPGRQIATLRRGEIKSLTGTFAFLSDNGSPLFT